VFISVRHIQYPDHNTYKQRPAGLNLAGRCCSVSAESAEHSKSNGRGHYLGYGVCQPEIVQTESGEQPAQRNKQENGPYHGEGGAFEGTSHCLKKHGKQQGYRHWYKAETDYVEAVNAYSQDFAVVGKKAYHLGRNEQEAQCSHTHQNSACDEGVPQDTASAFCVLLSVIEAYHGDYAGLQRAERYEEEGLPLIVKTEDCHCLI